MSNTDTIQIEHQRLIVVLRASGERERGSEMNGSSRLKNPLKISEIALEICMMWAFLWSHKNDSYLFAKPE